MLKSEVKNEVKNENEKPHTENDWMAITNGFFNINEYMKKNNKMHQPIKIQFHDSEHQFRQTTISDDDTLLFRAQSDRFECIPYTKQLYENRGKINSLPVLQDMSKMMERIHDKGKRRIFIMYMSTFLYMNQHLRIQNFRVEIHDMRTSYIKYIFESPINFVYIPQIFDDEIIHINIDKEEETHKYYLKIFN